VAADAGLPRIPCASVPKAVTLLPELVTAPDMFAFVVTVAALPVMLRAIAEEVAVTNGTPVGPVITRPLLPMPHVEVVPKAEVRVRSADKSPPPCKG